MMVVMLAPIYEQSRSLRAQTQTPLRKLLLQPPATLSVRFRTLLPETGPRLRQAELCDAAPTQQVPPNKLGF
jgi:hypothetical protein